MYPRRESGATRARAPGGGAILALLMLPLVAYAQSAPPAQSSGEVFTLGTLDVTGTALPAKPATVDRIDRARLDDLDLDRASSALNTLPGVTLQPGNRGGARNEASVYVRGFDLSRVPVLLDGVPIYVPYDGYIDLNRLTTFELSRIEVSKGYTSVLYGPNGMGGVINLVTRKPTRALEGSLSLGADFNGDGSFKGFRASANAGSRFGDWYMQAGVSLLTQDSIRLPSGFPAGRFQGPGQRIQSDANDFHLGFKVGYNPDALTEYVIGGSIQFGLKGAPPYAGLDATRATFFRWPWYDKQSIYFTGRTDLGDGRYLKTRLYYDAFQNRLLRFDNASYTTQSMPFAFTSDYSDFTIGGGMELGLPLMHNNMLRIAASVKYDAHREFGPTTPRSTMRDVTTSLAIEDTHNFGRDIDVVFGASYERRDPLQAQDPAFGGAVSFNTRSQQAFNVQAGVNYRPADDQTIFASVSRKTRFATIFERYSYRLGFAVPNPGLGPESALHLEAGYRGKVLPGLEARFSVFGSYVNDYIQNVTVGRRTVAPFNLITQAQNVGTTWFYGFEAGASYSPAPWLTTEVNYTFQRREMVNRDSSLLFGVPEHKLFATATVNVGGGFSFIPSVLYQSRWRTTDTGNGLPIGGDFIANLKVRFAVTEQTMLEAGVNNLFDRLYFYDDGYPAEGRNFFVTARHRF